MNTSKATQPQMATRLIITDTQMTRVVYVTGAERGLSNRWGTGDMLRDFASETDSVGRAMSCIGQDGESEQRIMQAYR